MTEEFTEETQETTGIEHNHNDFSSKENLNTGDKHMDQNNDSKFIVSPTDREPDQERMARCGGSMKGKVMLKVAFTPTVSNSNLNISGNEKSPDGSGETTEKIESADGHSQDSLKVDVMNTELSTSGDSTSLPVFKCAMQAESEAQNLSENTSQDILKDDTRSNAAVSDEIVAITQAEDVNSEEASTADSKEATMSLELQDATSVSSSDNDEPSKVQLLLIHSTEEDANANANIPITVNTNTLREGTENLNVGIPRPTENFGVQEKPTCADKAPETESHAERKRSASSLSGNSHESNESSSDQQPRKRTRTISFKVEATTLVKEVSLEIEPQEVVVSSCSTSPISELLEDSAEDMMTVNPDTEEASYGTLSRKRAKSGIDAVILKSATSARRSVKVNANVEVAVLDDAVGDENLLPVPRVSTFSRYRNTFSWKRDRSRSLTRQSFAGKSKENFLSFHNIGYTVPQKKFFRTIGTKVILKDVRYVCNIQFLSFANRSCRKLLYLFISGIMHTGVNAIMGPSGSGKTR